MPRTHTEHERIVIVRGDFRVLLALDPSPYQMREIDKLIVTTSGLRHSPEQQELIDDLLEYRLVIEGNIP